MKVTLKGRKTDQIKQGIEPWESREIEIDLSLLTPEQREVLAQGGDNYGVEGTVTELVESLQACVTKSATEKALAEARQKERDEDAMEWCRTSVLIESEVHESGVTIRQYGCPFQNDFGLSDDVKQTVLDRLAKFTAERDEKNKAARAAVADQIESAKAAIAAREEEEKAKMKAANAEKYAQRLATGIATIPMERGSRADWGEPWIAKLSTRNGKRPEYDFADGSYDASAKELSISCKPGEIIAYGQKNYRKAKRTIHNVRKMTDDGRLVAC